jgi:hypothetical protein
VNPVLLLCVFACWAVAFLLLGAVLTYRRQEGQPPVGGAGTKVQVTGDDDELPQPPRAKL